MRDLIGIVSYSNVSLLAGSIVLYRLMPREESESKMAAVWRMVIVLAFVSFAFNDIAQFFVKLLGFMMMAAVHMAVVCGFWRPYLKPC
jgi:hypothetical protein